MIRTFGLLSVGVAMGVAGMVGYQYLPAAFKKSEQSYAGQEQRQISSLSAKDIDALKNGQGWGLAKPAELNGYPGPAHILELDGELGLTENQRALVTAAFEEMRAEARQLGVQLIKAEAAIDAIFKSESASDAVLNDRLEAVARLRGKLRAIHLSAHIAVTPVLNDEQKSKYAQLRGYAGGHTRHEGH